MPMPVHLWQWLHGPGPHSSQDQLHSLPSPPVHWSREPCTQGKGLSSTDCQSPLGPSAPKMVRKELIFFLRGIRSRFVWEERSSGRLWGCIFNSLGFASYTWRLHPSWKDFGFELLRFIFSYQFKRERERERSLRQNYLEKVASLFSSCLKSHTLVWIFYQACVRGISGSFSLPWAASPLF